MSISLSYSSLLCFFLIFCSRFQYCRSEKAHNHQLEQTTFDKDQSPQQESFVLNSDDRELSHHPWDHIAPDKKVKTEEFRPDELFSGLVQTKDSTTTVDENVVTHDEPKITAHKDGVVIPQDILFDNQKEEGSGNVIVASCAEEKKSFEVRNNDPLLSHTESVFDLNQDNSMHDERKSKILSRIHGAKNWIDETKKSYNMLRERSLQEQRLVESQNIELKKNKLENENEISYLRNRVSSFRNLVANHNTIQMVKNYLTNEQHISATMSTEESYVYKENVFNKQFDGSNENIHEEEKEEEEERDHRHYLQIDDDIEHDSSLLVAVKKELEESDSFEFLEFLKTYFVHGYYKNVELYEVVDAISEGSRCQSSEERVWSNSDSLFDFLSYYGLAAPFETNLVRAGFTSIALLRQPIRLHDQLLKVVAQGVTNPKSIIAPVNTLPSDLHLEMLSTAIQRLRLVVLNVKVIQVFDLPESRGIFGRITRRKLKRSVSIKWANETKQTPTAEGANPCYKTLINETMFTARDVFHFKNFLGVGHENNFQLGNNAPQDSMSQQHINEDNRNNKNGSNDADRNDTDDINNSNYFDDQFSSIQFDVYDVKSQDRLKLCRFSLPISSVGFEPNSDDKESITSSHHLTSVECLPLNPLNPLSRWKVRNNSSVVKQSPATLVVKAWLEWRY